MPHERQSVREVTVERTAFQAWIGAGFPEWVP
jgi:hypothetical protein